MHHICSQIWADITITVTTIFVCCCYSCFSSLFPQAALELSHPDPTVTAALCAQYPTVYVTANSLDKWQPVLEPARLFIWKVLSAWPEPPHPSHGCLLTLGLELLPVCADKALALLPLRNLLPPLPWHFIINHKYHSLGSITLCVCQVFSVLFHLLFPFIPFVLPYRD